MTDMTDRNTESKRVLVALSGGVDSSGAALLLQRQGYVCDGAMLQLHANADSRDAEDARAVATRLGMGFHLFDERDTFCRCVVDAFVADYCAGLTPNPCIVCNRCLKFGALMDRAMALGYDYMATGHYARVTYDASSGYYRLLRGKDHRKDQSYVLYQLTQRQLAHLQLPVGELDKSMVRGLLEAEGIPIAHKPDSQDICFIPEGDYVRFLESQGIELRPGNFTDETGAVLGQHRGFPCYTLGQGKGLGIALGRHVYVLGKDAESNTVTLGDNGSLFRRTLHADNVNWIAEVPTEPFRCTAKTRYSQQEAACTVTPLPDRRVSVTFDEAQRAITPGQAVVLYRDESVLGGGTIVSTEK